MRNRFDVITKDYNTKLEARITKDNFKKLIAEYDTKIALCADGNKEMKEANISTKEHLEDEIDGLKAEI